MWQANVFSIFPEAFPGTLGVSLLGKALSEKKWNLNLIDLKQFALKYGRVDSKPYGSGAGMILSPLVFENAFNSLTANEKKMKKIYFSPRGRQFRQSDLQELSQADGITILCGRYEGIDQRIIDYFDFEEISIGDFVLMGGEVAAMAIIEGIVRLVPEVVGNAESIHTDSFQQHLLEYNQYTQPREFHNLKVSEILLSGNHEEIAKFRLNQSKLLTKEKRPDLWSEYIAEEIKKITSEKTPNN